MAAIILYQPPPEKPCAEGFGHDFRTLHLLRLEPRSDSLTQPLFSSIPTIDLSVSRGVLARVIAKAHRPYIIPPVKALTTRGGYERYCTDHPVPERDDNRHGHDGHDGRSKRRQPIVAMAFSPVIRSEGEVYARWRVATGGAAIISDDGVRGSSWGLRQHERGGFSLASPPISGTTGVAHEPRTGRPDSTSKC
jgi:hypothetical protein